MNRHASLGKRPHRGVVLTRNRRCVDAGAIATSREKRMNRLGEDLLRRTVRVAVVGCGGNGSVILSGLPYLHHALRAWGHPGGLHVTAIDGDAISQTNCVRQPFSASEIGMYKCVVLVNRL